MGYAQLVICPAGSGKLELSHVNILSKMDLVSNKKDVEEYLDPEAQVLLSQLNRQMHTICAVIHRQVHPIWGRR